jgi:putative membrane protein
VTTHVPLDVVRGGLIGAAEVVPGVSGGTIALVTGVYETLIGSAGHLVHGLRLLAARHRAEARTQLAMVRWDVVLPVLAGMVVAVVLGAALLEPVLEEHPVRARAVFAGLILASLVVPWRMVGRWTPGLYGVAAAAAVAAALLTGLPPGSVRDPALPLVALAAAVAVCALVLPGVSGSFLLLSVGLYETTIGAVNDRDLTYLGVFFLGAVSGLALFVRLLQHLLDHHHRVTLAVMTGLMAGSLRALWPWQTDERDLLAPTGDVGQVVALVVAGAAVVLVLVAVETRLARRPAPEPSDAPAADRS